MKRLFYNISSIVNPTLDGNMQNLDIIYHAALVTEDDRIIDIGAEDDLLDKYNFNELINLNQCMVMPSFIDAHTHPVFWKTREDEFEMRLKGMTYEQIAARGGGIKNSAKSLRLVSEDELFDVSLSRVKRFLEYGSTTIEAKSGYGLSFKDEVKSLRVIKRLQSATDLRIIPTFLGAHEIPEDYMGKKDVYIQLIIEEMLPFIKENELADYCDVFCEKNVFELEDTEKICLAAMDLGFKIRLHVDELNPLGGAELAAKLSAVSADHLLHVSDNGITALKEKNVVPILLPSTAFFLKKNQFAPARKMIEQGCPVALATDYNPGSSFTQNIQFVMTLAALKMGMLPNETVHAVTINAAKSLQLDQEIGSLHVGKKADFIVLNIPNYQHLLYNFAMNHVITVYKSGKKVFEKMDDYWT